MTDISIDGDALWFQGFRIGTLNVDHVSATIMQEFTNAINDLNDDKLGACQEALKEFIRDVGEAPYDELDIETLLTTFGDLIDE